jgi:hypothetical protein
MARGSKKKYTSKQKRKAHDIEKGYKKRGVSSKEKAAGNESLIVADDIASARMNY